MASHSSTSSCSTFYFHIPMRIFIPCYFSGYSFSEHTKDKFQIVHVVPEIFLFEPFKLFILAGSHAKCSFRDFGCKDCVISFFQHSPLFPLVCQFIPNGNSPDSFFNPIIRIRSEERRVGKEG